MKTIHLAICATRTVELSLRVIDVYTAARKTEVGQVLGHQLLRSATSVGAQYREACRARSTAEFISKIESARQELDESDYWIELLVRSGTVSESRMGGLRGEIQQLLAIFTASANTAKRNRKD